MRKEECNQDKKKHKGEEKNEETNLRQAIHSVLGVTTFLHSPESVSLPSGRKPLVFTKIAIKINIVRENRRPKDMKRERFRETSKFAHQNEPVEITDRGRHNKNICVRNKTHTAAAANKSSRDSTLCVGARQSDHQTSHHITTSHHARRSDHHHHHHTHHHHTHPKQLHGWRSWPQDIRSDQWFVIPQHGRHGRQAQNRT